MATGQVQRLILGVSSRLHQARTDAELLERFRAEGDEQSFSELIRRHGPMVLGVCRRVLGDYHAAEDAFQACFFVLARRAGAVEPSGALGAWLHGVAYRTALKARGRMLRRRQIEQHYAQLRQDGPGPRNGEPADREVLSAIDEALQSLPQRYQAPLVLCGVLGLSRAQAAEQLGLPEGTVASRLARARSLLHQRLTRRGLAVPAALLGPGFAPEVLAADLPSHLPASLAHHAALFAAGAQPDVSQPVLTLTREVLQAMSFTKWKVVGLASVATLVVAGTVGGLVLNAQEKPLPSAFAPTAAEGEKVKSADGEKPRKADGEGPREKKPDFGDAQRVSGRVEKVDAASLTLVISIKGDKTTTEQVVKVSGEAKVMVDGRGGQLSDIPAGAFIMALVPQNSNEAIGVMAYGPRLMGRVTKVEGDTVTIGPRGEDSKEFHDITLSKDTQLMVDGQAGSVADIKPGMMMGVQLSVDGKTALIVKAGQADSGDKPSKPKPEGGDKPNKPKPEGGEKPAK